MEKSLFSLRMLFIFFFPETQQMVTREQRKVAEELERIREGLRLHKGQRWNAGARHKEAKRGEQG